MNKLFQTLFGVVIFIIFYFLNVRPVDAIIDCSSGFTNINDGVSYKRSHTSTPREIDYYVLKITMNGSNHLFVTPRNNVGISTSQFASISGAEIAINGDYHSGTDPLGLAASSGDVYSNLSGEPSLYSLSDTDFDISNLQSVPAGIDMAISGGRLMVRNGNINPIYFEDCSTLGCPSGGSNCCDIHPRTSVGVGGNQIILILVDGRTSQSVGATLYEMAQMHVDCGSNKAIDFDGGSSTTLVLNGAVENHPSEGERAVANHLGFCLGHECQTTTLPPLPTGMPSQQTVRDPIPAPVVSCNDVRPSYPLYTDEEFHSLRPYEASPCNYDRTDLDIRCSNDVAVRDSLSILPNSPFAPDPGSCSWEGPPLTEGSVLTCHYSNIPARSFTSGFNPYASVLPVIGNTEWDTNVINAYQDVVMNESVKMNEYVSWYLHGAIYRSEKEALGYEQDLYVDYSDIDQVVINHPMNLEHPSDEQKIVNYSGPLRKLLPFDTQNQIRTAQVEDSFEGDIRHNQIILCTELRVGELVIPFLDWHPRINIHFVPVPCYDSSGNFLAISNDTRLEDVVTPPFESNYIGQDFGNFLRDYFDWKGLACASFRVEIIGTKYLFLCMDDPLNPQSNDLIFQYVPYSSTEDREGMIEARPELDIIRRNVDIESSGTTWLPKLYPSSDIDDVRTAGSTLNQSIGYFSHMEEANQLLNFLQDTYAPQELIDTPQYVTDEVSEVNASNRCVSVETRYNPGDRIFAQQLTADFTYTMSFECRFPYVCHEDCSSGTCVQICNYRSCYKYATWGMKLDSKVPLGDEVWKKSVGGNAGFYKRMFPKAGTEGSFQESIYDIPAESPVVHFMSENNNPGNTELISLDPKLYYSHLGGVKEYFLNNTQTALRPKGYGSSNQVWWGYGSPSTPPIDDGGVCPANCNDNTALYCPNKELYRATFEDLATRWLGNAGSPRLDKYDQVWDAACQQGIDPIFTVAIWLHESGASNYAGICEVLGDSNPGSLYCQRIQDLGINLSSAETVIELVNGTVNILIDNFDTQLSSFLNLPEYYLSSCGTSTVSCPMQMFGAMYHYGSCTPVNNSDSYIIGIYDIYTTLAPGTQVPCYPSQITYL